MENSKGQNRNQQEGMDQQRSRLSESESYSGQQNVSSSRGGSQRSEELNEQNVSSSRDRSQRSENLSEQNESVEGGQHQTVSTTRGAGGTNDIDRNRTSSRGTEQGRSSSGISTKRNVTGSDFDGQVSPE